MDAQFPAGRLRLRFRGPSGWAHLSLCRSLVDAQFLAPLGSCPSRFPSGCGWPVVARAVPRAPGCCPLAVALRVRAGPRLRAVPRAPWGAPTWGCSQAAGGVRQRAGVNPGRGSNPPPRAVARPRKGVGGNLCPQTPMLFSRTTRTSYRACRIEDGESRPAPTRRTNRTRPKGARGTARRRGRARTWTATDRGSTQGRGELRTHERPAQGKVRPAGRTWEAQAKATCEGDLRRRRVRLFKSPWPGAFVGGGR